MTGKDLLVELGNISQRYYDEAENESVSATHRSFRRPLLAAAVIAMTLLLVGCAVTCLLRMQILKIGNDTLTRTELDSRGNPIKETQVLMEILSSQGIKGTPNYLANQEWLQFVQSYTPELEDDWDLEEDYWAYGVQDQTMVDKVDEICGKYGLQVIGKPWHEHSDCMEFLPLLGVDHLLKPNSNMELMIPQGRFFPGGSFNVYGSLALPDGTVLPDLSFDYIKKDVFYDVFVYLNRDIVTERNYTTKEGIDLLLLESPESGMILLDREDCFITLSIGLREDVALEDIAEQFDYSVRTGIPEAEAAAAREQASIDAANADDPFAGRFVRDTYEEYVEDVLWSDRWKLQNGFTAEEIPERGRLLYDLDGNGEEELLIFQDGYIQSIISKKDGKTTEGKTYHMTLCENNVLIDVMELTPGETWYHIFCFADDGNPVFSNPKERSIVRLKVKDGSWWRTSSTDHYAEFDTQITEAEAMELLNAYKPVKLNILPMDASDAP